MAFTVSGHVAVAGNCPPQTTRSLYYSIMHAFLTVLTSILLLATLGVLIAGLVCMAREQDPARSNRLMRWRVILQASAIVLLVIMMSLLRS